MILGGSIKLNIYHYFIWKQTYHRSYRKDLTYANSSALLRGYEGKIRNVVSVELITFTLCIIMLIGSFSINDGTATTTP